MKKLLVGLLVAFVAQGSLLQGTEHLNRLYKESLIRKTCTSLMYQNILNSYEVNDACKFLNDQYAFFKQNSEIDEDVKTAAKSQKRDEYLNKAAKASLNNRSLDFAVLNSIDTILPQASQTCKRIEFNELLNLKFNLAKGQLERENERASKEKDWL